MNDKKGMAFLITGVSIFIAIIVIVIIWIILNSELNADKGERKGVNVINVSSNEVIQNGTENPNGTVKQDSKNKEKFELKYTNNKLKIITEQQRLEVEENPDSGQVNPNANLYTTKFEILGLKDTNVQEKINNEIRGIINLYTQNNCIVRIEEKANFADILSIEIYASSLDTANPAYRTLGLNYRLDNGEKLRLQDLFNSDRDARTALKECIEKKIEAYSGDLTKYSETQDIKGLDIKELGEFDNNKSYDFVFSPSKISIYNIGQDTDKQDVRHVIIPLFDYFDKIAIFTKYVSKTNLYETEQIENNIENTENQAYMELNKYSTFKKIDDTTYVIQYFMGNVNTDNPVEIEKLKNQADYDANKIKNQNTGHKILIQNMQFSNSGEIKTKLISTNAYIVKPEYFESDKFYKDLANGDILEGAYTININNDYVVSSDIYATNAQL